jgi:hypothetical protein
MQSHQQHSPRDGDTGMTAEFPAIPSDRHYWKATQQFPGGRLDWLEAERAIEQEAVSLGSVGLANR